MRTKLNTHQLGDKTINVPELDDDVTQLINDRVHTVNGMSGDVVIDTSIINAVSTTIINIPDATLKSISTTIATTNPVIIDTFTNTSLEFLCQVNRNYDFQVNKLLVLFDGTNIYATEYGLLYNNDILGHFDVDVLNNEARLLFISESEISTTIKVFKTTFV